MANFHAALTWHLQERKHLAYLRVFGKWLVIVTIQNPSYVWTFSCPSSFFSIKAIMTKYLLLAMCECCNENMATRFENCWILPSYCSFWNAQELQSLNRKESFIEINTKDLKCFRFFKVETKQIPTLLPDVYIKTTVYRWLLMIIFLSFNIFNTQGH